MYPAYNSGVFATSFEFADVKYAQGIVQKGTLTHYAALLCADALT